MGRNIFKEVYVEGIMEDKTVLSKEQVQEAVQELEGWIVKNNTLEKTWQFFQFKELIDFLKKCIHVMDEQNHHSDLRFDTKNKLLTVSVTTHSINALTRADVDFARALQKA